MGKDAFIATNFVLGPRILGLMVPWSHGPQGPRSQVPGSQGPGSQAPGPQVPRLRVPGPRYQARGTGSQVLILDHVVIVRIYFKNFNRKNFSNSFLIMLFKANGKGKGTILRKRKLILMNLRSFNMSYTNKVGQCKKSVTATGFEPV